MEAEKSADVQTSGFTSKIYYMVPKQVFQLKWGKQKPAHMGPDEAVGLREMFATHRTAKGEGTMRFSRTH